MNMNFRAPDSRELKPRITVMGIGGAGGNAVNNMINARLEGVSFIVANTDAQALMLSRAERKIQLGTELTQGLGAGAKPEIGQGAATESLPEILEQISGSHMVFITAGMGGGTGTGAAPVIARAVREQGMLTVGVVTKPFHFEGERRMRIAERGIEELQNYVDTLIIIPNQNLFRVANERTTFAQAFAMADDVLHSGVRGVTDLIVMPGLINRDFADIRTVMSEMGKAMMGTGEMSGEGRALKAAEAAISNPLLEDASMKGARAVLINVTGGPDLMLFEVDEAVNRIRAEVDGEANILFGSALSEDMEGRVRVSVVATGIDAASDVKLSSKTDRYAAMRKPAVAAESSSSDALRAAQSVGPAEAVAARADVLSDDMSEESPVGAEDEVLVLGGRDAPVISEPAHRSMDAVRHPVHDRPKRRVFGLFGGRKRNDVPAIDPQFDIPGRDSGNGTRQPETMTFRLQQPSVAVQNSQVVPEQRERPKARPADLFSDTDDDFEIPAFLRRQKTGS